MSDGVKVTVLYSVDPTDLQSIDLAVVKHAGSPSSADWQPAYRDTTTDGQAVVWARFPSSAGTVWLRDRDGQRAVTSSMVV